LRFSWWWRYKIRSSGLCHHIVMEAARSSEMMVSYSTATLLGVTTQKTST